MKRSLAKRAIDGEEKWAPAPVPDTSDLREVAEASKSCTACHLYKRGTQTVFGEGPKRAPLMLLVYRRRDAREMA